MTLPDAYVSSRRFEINELFLVARTLKPCATENGGTSQEAGVSRAISGIRATAAE